ncbi:acyltransferase [Ralstonia sp. CHL-2022]|uniref:Acyltransferase n=1 Tax=Ralstonia mojiangensis TaxID=2953895 RepID=A0ABT2LE48_9RALS|nr:acyltransferase [Ralstonia mojiangensis]MCT7295437.1 acyltransferase [Ralstonia mojiangensis]MCT7313680.1 acyltransferase [Ralstonia mojiangensis]
MLRSIQVLRAVAAWLVVGHHVMALYFAPDEVSNPIGKFFAQYGALGVDLFFVVSGLVIYMSSSARDVSPLQFAYRRAIRVVPAYWLFTAIAAILLLIDPAFLPATQFTPELLVKSLLFLPMQNPSGSGPFPLLTVGWTLNCEMFFYCLFAISLFLPGKARLPALLTALWLAQMSAQRSQTILVFYSNPFLFDFVIGVMVGLAFEQRWPQRLPHTMAAVLIACSLWLLKASHGDHDPLTAGLGCGAVAIVFLRYNHWFDNLSLLSTLGDWSYSTYLCHILILGVGLYAHTHWHVRLRVILPLALVLIAVASKISHSLIEVKTKEWLLQVRRRRSGKFAPLRGTEANTPLE